MSASGLEAAGQNSFSLALTAVIADKMNWLNDNADGMGIVIGAGLLFVTAAFYFASWQLKKEENRINAELKRESILDEISKEFYSKLDELEYSEETKSDAIEIVCQLLDRRKDN